MGDTNYLGTIVKILEKPTSKVVNNKIVSVEFRAQLPQVRRAQIINLVFWGNLARDVANYYKVNDYIIVEGYLSLRTKVKSKSTKRNLKKAQVTVLRSYPI